MAIYPSSGGFIGSLLRTIQEERSKAPHVLPPAGEPQAPIRTAVQAPLESPISPESPGSARTVSIRPEGVPPTAASAPAGQVVPARTMVGDMGGVSPIIREKFPEAFNGSEASAVQNQQQSQQQSQQSATETRPSGAPAQSQQGSQVRGRNLDAEIQAQGTEIQAQEAKIQQIQQKIDELNRTSKPAAVEAAKNRLIAASGPQGRTPEQERRLSQQNYQAPPKQPSLFQQLSSGIQNKAQSTAGKIKGLFQRLF